MRLRDILFEGHVRGNVPQAVVRNSSGVSLDCDYLPSTYIQDLDGDGYGSLDEVVYPGNPNEYLELRHMGRSETGEPFEVTSATSSLEFLVQAANPGEICEFVDADPNQQGFQAFRRENLHKSCAMLRIQRPNPLNGQLESFFYEIGFGVAFPSHALDFSTISFSSPMSGPSSLLQLTWTLVRDPFAGPVTIDTSNGSVGWTITTIPAMGTVSVMGLAAAAWNRRRR